MVWQVVMGRVVNGGDVRGSRSTAVALRWWYVQHGRGRLEATLQFCVLRFVFSFFFHNQTMFWYPDTVTKKQNVAFEPFLRPAGVKTNGRRSKCRFFCEPVAKPNAKQRAVCILERAVVLLYTSIMLSCCAHVVQLLASLFGKSCILPSLLLHLISDNIRKNKMVLCRLRTPCKKLTRIVFYVTPC